jgi:uncharacterized protein involved in exopolysaccharide biosynthesis
MTGPVADAAGREPAVADLSPRESSSFIDIMTRLRERWWIIAAALVVSFAIAGAYLASATPRYDVTAVLMAEQGGTAAGASPAEFLAAQRRALLSPPVQSDDIAKLFPTADVDKEEATLTITIETNQPRDAAAALARMLEGYLKTAGNQPATVAQKLAELTAQREKLAADRDMKTKALTDFRKQNNLSGTVADTVVHARQEQLAHALADAKAQAAKAKAEVDAAATFPTDPAQRAALIDAARVKGAFKELDQQRSDTSKRLVDAESQLEQQKQTLLSQHPALVQTKNTVEQLKARRTALEAEYPQAYRTFCQRQLAAADRKVTELQALLAQQTQRAQQSGGDAQKLAQLEAAVKEAEAALAEADQKIREATISSDNSMQMKLIQPPTAGDRPSHPRRAVVLLTAAAIGLVGGLALALMGRR